VKRPEESKTNLRAQSALYGSNALMGGDQEKQAKIDLQKAPRTQRDALKQKLNELSDQAVQRIPEASKSLV